MAAAAAASHTRGPASPQILPPRCARAAGPTALWAAVQGQAPPCKSSWLQAKLHMAVTRPDVTACAVRTHVRVRRALAAAALRIDCA